MKKLNIYIIIGALLLVSIGGFSYWYITRDSSNSDQNTKNGISLNFDEPLCEQIPSSVIEDATGKSVVKTETNSSSGLNVCQYYINDTSFVTLRLNSLSYESQKKAQESLGRTITTNPEIKAEHFIAVQENGLINDIILKLDDNLFLAVDRSSTSVVDNEMLITLASQVSEYVSTETSDNSEKDETGATSNTSHEDVVRDFFTLIDDGKASDAALAMSSKNTNDDSTKQAWAVQFNDITSVKVTAIKPAMESSWTDTSQEYEVTLDITMDPDSANSPIPYYGYENGKNTRYIHIVKEQDDWMIDEIATGP